MLQHRVHAPDLVARALGVVRSHNGLQQSAPKHGAGVIVGINGRQQVGLAGLLHPQLQLGLVGIEANGSRSIGAANACATHLQPIISCHVLGRYQAQSGTLARAAGMLHWCFTDIQLGIAQQMN